MGAYPILNSGKPIVFFDTTCLLCNRLVKLLIRFDKKQQFIIAGTSSDLGLFVQSKFNITEDTIMLFHCGNCKTKSAAFLAICKLLGFPFYFMSIFYLFPTSLRNSLYDLIASNRKNWFGTSYECLLYTETSERIIH